MSGPAIRDASGRFVPGQSGNPSGRRKGLVQLSALARTYTEEAIETLATIMRTGRPRDRVIAAESLLDRGWGRPAQSVHHLGPDGGPMEIAVLSPEERRARIQELLARCDDLAALPGPDGQC